MATVLAGRRKKGAVLADGFSTPKADKRPQKMPVPPKRVIPILFLPGIMGSNLRLSAERQNAIGASNNKAWRPDHKVSTGAMMYESPSERQMKLDMDHTEVDIYDPVNNPTGDPNESAKERNDKVEVDAELPIGSDGVLLVDDPVRSGLKRSKEQKALERGWGEVYFTSYRGILEKCESVLNSHKLSGRWKEIIDANPQSWGAYPPESLKPLTEDEFKKAVTGCLYPVHAMGYNWLKSSGDAAKEIKRRCDQLIKRYVDLGYTCEKIILVTHSMGGLVARALIHPEIGGFAEKILGIVHGVMPAIGAPAAYKRIRCGFEELAVPVAPAPKILGNFGTEITAVLANSAGGLELLPSKSYGNGWLRVCQGKTVFTKLPRNGDPYEEIYKVRGKWFGLIKEEWINPANDPKASFERTSRLLDHASEFHSMLKYVYHSQTYAHYGADQERASWESITWEVGPGQMYQNWDSSAVLTDNAQGEFSVESKNPVSGKAATVVVRMGVPVGAGDQTVPVMSSDDQLRSGKLKGIFRQVGYEHQASYDDENALNSTLYSLVKIIQKMQWKK